LREFPAEFGGAFWESPEILQRYIERSPLTYAGNVTTPLLLLQSEGDFRCPIDQGEQMLQALRARDQTVELVRIPNATHVVWGSGAPMHRYLQWTLLQEWFDRYVKERSAAREAEQVPVRAAEPARAE
jgi:dipeptidyl aminopeptidase/acylaminoacyl peptidase